MTDSHIVELPKFVWIIKIVQLVLAVLVLAFSAYCDYKAPVPAHALTIYTAVFNVAILTYYFVAIHAAPKAYNWIALLVLECLAVIFWLTTWAVLAAWIYALIGIDYYGYYSYNFDKRDITPMLKRGLSDVADAYAGLLVTSLVFSLIEFILYCVTLTYMGIGIHRHQVAGRPIVGTNSSIHADQHGQEVTPNVPPAPSTDLEKNRQSSPDATAPQQTVYPVAQQEAPVRHEREPQPYEGA